MESSNPMTIYIPTRGRTDRQETWDWLPQKWKDRTYVVCPPDEVVSHESHNRNALSCPAVGIGPTRQWIIENAKTDMILMTDDDHKFYKRLPDDWHLRYCNNADMDEMLRSLEYLLKMQGFCHVGMSARQGNNRTYPDHYKDVARQNNVHGFDRQVLLDLDIRFDVLPLMEDFHVTLSLLELGYPNRVIQDYCWGQWASNRGGGCSLYRDNDLQAKAAEQLARLHPDFVTVVTKKAKAGWKNMDDRKDVRIQWKKSFGSKDNGTY